MRTMKTTSSHDPSAAASPLSGLFGLDSAPEKAGVHVIPVPWDATASYRKGAHLAPEAIKLASHQVDLFDLHNGRPYELGIAMLDADPRIAELNREASELADHVLAVAGDVSSDPSLVADLARVNELGAQLNAIVRENVGQSLDDNRLAAVIGGDHSVPFGAIQAAADRHTNLGILHIDAHADLRDSYEGFTWSHASIFHNVIDKIDGVSKIVQMGVRDLCEEEHHAIQASPSKLHTLFDHQWAAERFSGRDLRPMIRSLMAQLPTNLWISIDVDGLDPSLCPNTGTPVPGGFDWHSLMFILDELKHFARNVVGFDLCEVNPGANWNNTQPDSWDAMVGARLLYRLIGFAQKPSV